MKKLLLGTTALVAAGAFAGAAQADEMMAEPISVGVGGYYTIALIAESKDSMVEERGHFINQNMEMQLSGSTTLDNGITAGVRVRFTANDYEHSDEQEVTFSGGFGGLHVGAIEGAAQQMSLWVPGSSSAIGGIQSPWFGGIGGAWTTNAIMNEDSLKAVYFSPSFNGISLGLSYAPNNSTDSYTSGSTAGGGNAEQLAAALSYSVDVMGGSFSANVGMESYTNDGGGDNPSAMRYGATLSIDQIGIGAVVHTQDLGGGAENSYADVGIGWSQGPLMLGVQWASRETGTGDSDITALNANYNLGPGIDLGAQIGMGSRRGNDFTQFLLGTWFAF